MNGIKGVSSVDLTFLPIQDSLGAFRRATVLGETLYHSQRDLFLQVKWNYCMRHDRSTPNEEQGGSEKNCSAFVGALPVIRQLNRNKTIGSLIHSEPETILKRYAQRVCGVCGKPLPEPANAELLEIAEKYCEAVLLLAIKVSVAHGGDEKITIPLLRNLADMLSVERIISPDGNICRVDSELLEIRDIEGCLFALDSTRGAMLLSNQEQLHRWVGLINRFGKLETFYSYNRNTSQFASELISDRFCPSCGVTKESLEVELSIGGLLISQLVKTPIKDVFEVIKTAPELKPHAAVISYLIERGFDECLWGDTAGDLDDRSFTLWLLLFTLSRERPLSIYAEGFFSLGITEADCRAAIDLYRERFLETTLIFYDVNLEGIPGAVSRAKEPHSEERLVNFNLKSGGRLDSLGTLSGILRVAAPLYAGTAQSRTRGIKRDHFLFKSSEYYCAVCAGGGGSFNSSFTCEGCKGGRITETLGDIEYHGLSFSLFLGATIDELGKVLEDPRLYKAIEILQAFGLGSARLQDSSALFDVGEMTRIHLTAKLLGKKQKGNGKIVAYNVPWFTFGLSVEFATIAINSLLAYLPPQNKVYAIDDRPEIQKMLREFM